MRGTRRRLERCVASSWGVPALRALDDFRSIAQRRRFLRWIFLEWANGG
jgi:hypothetical protein